MRALDFEKIQLEGFRISVLRLSSWNSWITCARSSGSSSAIFSMHSLSSRTPGSSGTSWPPVTRTLGVAAPRPPCLCWTSWLRALAKSHLEGLTMRSAALAAWNSVSRATRSSGESSSSFCSAASSTPLMPRSSRKWPTSLALALAAPADPGASSGALVLALATTSSNACSMTPAPTPETAGAGRGGPGAAVIRPESRPRVRLTRRAETFRIGLSLEWTTRSWNSSHSFASCWSFNSASFSNEASSRPWFMTAA